MEPRARKIMTSTGLELHVLEWGADTQATHTVFLVHGFLDSGWTFQRTVDAWLALAPERALHIVAPDMRGHGDSDRVGAGGYYHFFDYLADMHDLVRALGRERVSLVGHSMGATICSYYAGAYSRNIHNLVLLEGLGIKEEPLDMPARVRGWIASRARMRAQKPVVSPSLEHAAMRLRRHDPLLPEDMALELAGHLTREHEDGGLCFKHDPEHMTVGPYPFRTDIGDSFWRAIQCPVLFVSGSASSLKLYAEELERRLALMGDVRSHVIEGAGHMVQRHAPDEVARLLDGFVSG